MIRKEIVALRKSPYLIAPPWTWSIRKEKSGLLPIAEISGLMMSATRALTIAVNAAPITTAMARSTTLPRRMKSRNPLSIFFSGREGICLAGLPENSTSARAGLHLLMFFKLALHEQGYRGSVSIHLAEKPSG